MSGTTRISNPGALRMKQSTPILLIVDDDPIVLNRFRLETLDNTNLGVVHATTLQEAVRLLGELLPIAAVLTDINFPARSQTDKMSSGFDLLSYVKQEHPEVLRYAMSMLSDRGDKGSHCQYVFDKMQPIGSIAPWTRIESDVMACYTYKNSRSQLDSFHQTRHGATDTRLQHSRLTYLQSDLNEAIQFIRPLPIFLVNVRDGFVVSCADYPLVLSAFGETIDKAEDTLRTLLVRVFHNMDKDNVSGFDRQVFLQLCKYLAPQQLLN